MYNKGWFDNGKYFVTDVKNEHDSSVTYSVHGIIQCTYYQNNVRLENNQKDYFLPGLNDIIFK